MITKQKFNERVDIIYFEDSTKITNSYYLTNEEIEKVAEQVEYSRHVIYDWRCKHIRKKKSYIREIKAHNKLFNLGLFKSHTIDTDLEEDISIWEEMIWRILSI